MPDVMGRPPVADMNAATVSSSAVNVAPSTVIPTARSANSRGATAVSLMHTLRKVAGLDLARRMRARLHDRDQVSEYRLAALAPLHRILLSGNAVSRMTGLLATLMNLREKLAVARVLVL